VGVVAVDVPADAALMLLEGGLAILPTDTVYGAAAAATLPDACRRLYQLKQRPLDQPTAIMLGSVDSLINHALAGLPDRTAAICRQLLPGPVTLVVPNTGGRFGHLCGASPDRIGVRVPDLEPAIAELADAVGGLVITSANERGGRDPARLEQVPQSIRDAAVFVVDGGALPGVASTVIDVTGAEPRVLRHGAGAERMMAALR
jgi:L-threonylcarbamoyladenylate synthase